MWQIIMMQAYNDYKGPPYSSAILQSEFTTLDSNMYGRLHRGKRAREIAQINLGICKMEWAVTSAQSSHLDIAAGTYERRNEPCCPDPERHFRHSQGLTRMARANPDPVRLEVQGGTCPIRHTIRSMSNSSGTIRAHSVTHLGKLCQRLSN